MALKSSREGLRKELVDYLGNLIVDDNLRNEIVQAVSGMFITQETLNESVNNLTMQITTETGERIEADDTLQNNINTETTARQDADNILQENINAETTARQEAITSLQASIEEATANAGKFYGIDASRLLASYSAEKTISYSATEDCFLSMVVLLRTGGITSFYIDDVLIAEDLYNGNIGQVNYFHVVPLKQGQTIKNINRNDNLSIILNVYGIKG